LVKYTWWDQVTRARDRNIGWRLDYFFVSPDLRDKIVSTEVCDDVMGSDHCPITLTLDL
jgi:exodeoxyribonuclease-3